MNERMIAPPPRHTIHITDNFNHMQREVYIVKFEDGKYHRAKIEWEEIDAGILMNAKSQPSFIEPLLPHINNGRDMPLIRSINESLENLNINKKLVSQEALEGRIKATEQHLQDMRALVFNDDIKVSRE